MAGQVGTFVGLLELRLRGQVRHRGCDVVCLGGVYDLGDVDWICIVYGICSMYWDHATEEEKKKRAEERAGHYIHFLSILCRTRKEGTGNGHPSDKNGRSPRPTAGAGCVPYKLFNVIIFIWNMIRRVQRLQCDGSIYFELGIHLAIFASLCLRYST